METLEEYRDKKLSLLVWLKIVPLGFFVVLFGTLFGAQWFIRGCEKKIQQDVKQRHAQVQILEVSNNGDIFPKQYRAVCYDTELGFTFLQDYHVEKFKPNRTQNLMMNYETQLTSKMRCDECIEQISLFFDAPYFTQYDPDLNGFCLFTTETDAQKLMQLLADLQALPQKKPLLFSIIVCSEPTYQLFKNANMKRIMKDPALVINDAGYQRGVCMMIFATEEGCTWMQGETDAVEALSAIRIDDICNEDTSSVIELDGKIGSDEATFRVWKID